MVHKVACLLALTINVILSVYLVYSNFEHIKKYPYSNIIVRLTLYTSWLFYSFCCIFKGAFVAMDRSNQVPHREKVKRDLCAGYGLIMLMGVVISVLVVLIRHTPSIIYPCVFIANFSSLPIFLLFVARHLDNYSVAESIKSLRFKFIITVCQLAFSLLTSFLTYEFSTDDNARMVFSITMWYTVFFSPAISEFFAIMGFGIKLKYEEEPERVGVYEQRESGGQICYRPPGAHTSSARRTTMASMVKAHNTQSPIQTELVNEEEQVLQNHSSTITQCKICTQEYSDTVIPRVLVTCGHTLCQGCIGNLLEDQLVLCPFCRKATIVSDGNADQLPRNYAILEMVQERSG